VTRKEFFLAQVRDERVTHILLPGSSKMIAIDRHGNKVANFASFDPEPLDLVNLIERYALPDMIVGIFQLVDGPNTAKCYGLRVKR